MVNRRKHQRFLQTFICQRWVRTSHRWPELCKLVVCPQSQLPSYLGVICWLHWGDKICHLCKPASWSTCCLAVYFKTSLFYSSHSYQSMLSIPLFYVATWATTLPLDGHLTSLWKSNDFSSVKSYWHRKRSILVFRKLNLSKFTIATASSCTELNSGGRVFANNA